MNRSDSNISACDLGATMERFRACHKRSILFGYEDDAVRRALSLWTFEPPGHPLDQVIDLTLKQ